MAATGAETVRSMRAWVARRYGGPEVVELATVDVPIPGGGDLLVRVRATSVNSGDVRMRAADFPYGMATLARLALGWSGLRQPVLGVEFAGVVDAVGADVTDFQVGDRVVAMTGMRCGAHAELAVVSASGCVAKIPDTLGFAEAVALPFGGTTALSFLRTHARLARGERLLVIGATGSVGAAAVQVGRRLGAVVTAVASSRLANPSDPTSDGLTLARSLGAERVIDYMHEDPLAVGEWDVIVDTVGEATVRAMRARLAPQGRLVLVAAGLGEVLSGPWVRLTSSTRIITGPCDESAADLRDLVDWASAGEYVPLIDQRLSFDQVVDAHRHADTRRKRGTIVLEIA